MIETSQVFKTCDHTFDQTGAFLFDSIQTEAVSSQKAL
jgi:hypothetical protein